MKPIYKYCLLLLGVVWSAYSCYRRPLEEEYKATIPIGADWTKAELTPQNVTVLFYNQNTGNLVLEHQFEHNDQRIQSHVDLPVGIYTVVLFNEIREQVSGVGIRGYENFETLEAYAKPNPNAITRGADGPIVHEPGILATVIVTDFEVTSDMVAYTRYSATRPPDEVLVPPVETLVDLIPERKVCQLQAFVHVDGINNARMPVLAYIHNMAEGYSFRKDQNITLPVSHQFTLDNRVYDVGSTQNGTITATINTFGVLGERNTVNDQPEDKPIVFDMYFMLVDQERTIVNRTFDVTPAIGFSPENNGSITLDLGIGIEQPLPEVIPGGTEDSGFGADLVDWGIIDVPLGMR